jgi:hypothetical protein
MGNKTNSMGKFNDESEMVGYVKIELFIIALKVISEISILG